MYFPTITDGTPLIVPGGLAVLAPNRIKVACEDMYNCQEPLFTTNMNVYAVKPFQPVVPRVEWLTPSTLIYGNDLFIDASSSFGNAGRNWTIAKFSVISSTAGVNVARIQGKLDALKDPMSTTVIPAEFFVPSATYFFSLHLKNYYMKESTGTLQVRSVFDTDIPHAYILRMVGDQFFPSTTMEILISARNPTSSRSSFTFSWSVYRGSTFMPSIQSVSENPALMKLNPYTLQAGFTYNFICTVTTATGGSIQLSKSYFVLHGYIHSSIVGGGVRRVPFNMGFQLDSSESFDDYLGGTSVLAASWSCTYQDVDHFGESCDFVFGENSVSRAVVHVADGALAAGFSYKFTVHHSTPDNRRNSSSVIIHTTDNNCGARAIVSILTPKFPRFNQDSKSPLLATVQGWPEQTYSYSWSISNGLEAYVGVALNATSAVSGNFSVTDIEPLSLVPLSMKPSSLEGQREYTFRLDVMDTFYTGCSLFAEYSVTINMSPIPGTFTVSPTDGVGLETKFYLQATSWTDDTSDYPLTYSYYYAFASAPDDFYPLSLSQDPQILNTWLPAGYAQDGHRLILMLTIADFFNSSSVVSVNVTSRLSGKPLNLSHISSIVESTLEPSLIPSTWNSVIGVMNALTHSLNEVNCSVLLDCGQLHRAPCSAVAHTCGSCLPGFVGVIGASNYPCSQRVNTSSDAPPSSALISMSRKLLGNGTGRCLSDAECSFASCVNSTCVTWEKQCPTNDPVAVCSGFGDCRAMDGTGNPLPSCAAMNQGCEVFCVCDAYHGGRDCSYSLEEVLVRENARALMCAALDQMSTYVDASVAFVTQASTTLLQVFDPYELRGVDGITSCSNSMYRLFAAAGRADGNIRQRAGNTFEMQTSSTVKTSLQIMPQIISKFLDSLKVATIYEFSKDTKALFVQQMARRDRGLREIATNNNFNNIPGAMQMFINALHLSMFQAKPLSLLPSTTSGL